MPSQDLIDTHFHQAQVAPDGFEVSDSLPLVSSDVTVTVLRSALLLATRKSLLSLPLAKETQTDFPHSVLALTVQRA